MKKVFPVNVNYIYGFVLYSHHRPFSAMRSHEVFLPSVDFELEG